MIPAEIIEEIRNKSDLVKVVSEYVPIKKRGKNYLGLCPFHAEKDASFTVSPEKQLFHCFGCNEGGNVFAFIMKIENIGFAEAAEELGSKLGISMPKPSGKGPSRSEKDTLYQVMLLAAQCFKSALQGAAGEPARSYLEKRGITEKTRDLFRLGFAPEGWDILFKHLISRGAAPDQIEKTGLILPREGKNGYYDRFRHRLIFPVLDARDRIVAFGGRSLGNEEPKYLNSPDTAIYHKGETLFGLNLSKDHIKNSKTAVLVEGNFDLITPFQAGITNIVATMGTALTPSQCKLLARYCDTVILAYDADAAGFTAAERSIELMRGQGLKVKVAQLSGGKDPDDMVRNQGKAAFEKCLADSLPFLEFKILRVFSRHNLKEIEARSKALGEIAGILAPEEPFIQKEYAKLAAAALRTDPDTVLAEARRSRDYQKSAGSSLRRVTAKPNSKIIEAEKDLISLAAQDAESLKAVKENLSLEDFSLPETRAIAELMFTADFAGNSHFLLENLPDDGARKFLSRLLVSEHLSQTGGREAIVADCIKVIKDGHLQGKINGLKLELKAAEKAGEAGKAAELLSALKSEIS